MQIIDILINNIDKVVNIMGTLIGTYFLIKDNLKNKKQ